MAPLTFGRVNADFSSGGAQATAEPARASGTGASVLLDPPSSGLSDPSDAPLRTEPIRPSGEAGDGWGRAAAYDAYADGLHTYAIWSLRDHDAAVDALYCAFVIADRNITQLRQPEQIQPWLYALLRRECMLREAQASTASAPSTSSAASSGMGSVNPVSGRLRPPGG